MQQNFMALADHEAQSQIILPPTALPIYNYSEVNGVLVYNNSKVESSLEIGELDLDFLACFCRIVSRLECLLQTPPLFLLTLFYSIDIKEKYLTPER